jgi:zinc protease
LAAIAADPREKPVSADELDRAKTPLVETRLRGQQRNAFWLGALGDTQRDPRGLDVIRTRVTGVQAVTADDVQNMSRKYLGATFRSR